MNPATALTLTAALYRKVRRHLFPGDGLEAAAILICARTPGPRARLLARDAVLVAHKDCARREPDFLTWPGIAIEAAIDRAEKENLSLILLHSHPGGLFAFSTQDDRSDRSTMPSLFQALGPVHGSAIMTPDGAMLARLYEHDLKPRLLDVVSIAGDDIRWFWSDGEFARRPMAFTSATQMELSRLCACVIGVSGTGSIMAEQAARLGFGQVQLIDFDKLEKRNLNRILNSTLEGANRGELKVHGFAAAIEAFRGPGVAVPLAEPIDTREAVLLASQADVLFSCVDTLDGRHIADLMAAAFMIPLFDVGVSIPTRADGQGGIAIGDVCGRIDYVQPGGATLRDRGVYDPQSLRAEYLRRFAPKAHEEEAAAGYIKGSTEREPSVITLNMRAAAACMMEFIARTYPFRHAPNEQHARTEFSLAAHEEELTSEASFARQPNDLLGRGDREPLLGLPALRLPRKGTAA